MRTARSPRARARVGLCRDARSRALSGPSTRTDQGDSAARASEAPSVATASPATIAARQSRPRRCAGRDRGCIVSPCVLVLALQDEIAATARRAAMDCGSGGRQARRSGVGPLCAPFGDRGPKQIERARRYPAELEGGAEVVAVGPVLDHLAVGDPQPVRLGGREAFAGGREDLPDAGLLVVLGERRARDGRTSCSGRRRGRLRRRPRGSPSSGRRTRLAATAR